MQGSRGVPTALSGGTPFPHIDDWRADGALFAHQSLASRRLKPDPGSLLADISGLPRDEWECLMLHPAVFAYLADEPRRWTVEELCQSILSLPPTEPGESVVARVSDERFTELLRRLGPGSQGANCSRASFLDPASSEFARFTTQVQSACELIESVAPGFARDQAAVVHAVALVDREASFRGSSGVIHRGLVLLSPDLDWTVGVFAEELVHETTHNLLDLISLRTPLVSGDGAFIEKYSAPFRPDKRHLYGNFHAIIVVARLLHLFERFEILEVDGIDWIARGRDYAARSRPALDSILKYPGLSHMGRRLLDRLVIPTLNAPVWQ